MTEAKAILVIGAGDATGGAIARRFAREGYIACVTRRTADKLEPLVAADPRRRRPGARLRQRRAQGRGHGRAGREDRARDRADRGGGVQHRRQRALPGITETTARVYFKVWEMACFGGFLMGREVAKVDAAARPRHDHLHRRHGQPARPRGLRRLRRRQARAARAGAEHGARALAAGHPRRAPRDRRRDRHRVHPQQLPRALRAQGPSRASSSPEHIADAYWQIHQQPRDAWTHETELRPWIESW